MDQADGRQETRGLSYTPVIHSLVSGSLSGAFTTILYQPFELLKTRIQLEASKRNSRQILLGRATKSALELVRSQSLVYLWRGTGASLVRSIPGVGVYYTTLNILQSNFSQNQDRPDSSGQGFCFGFVARSLVSVSLLPVSSVKVRYESGQYKYSSLAVAIKDAYFRNGWVGLAPTLLRDSLFSGIYYMCYTSLKSRSREKHDGKIQHSTNFHHGIISGLTASLITNPLDVIKTNVQVHSAECKTMRGAVASLMDSPNRYFRFFDGLALRSLRRTLIAATTWTFYELMTENLRLKI